MSLIRNRVCLVQKVIRIILGCAENGNKCRSAFLDHIASLIVQEVLLSRLSSPYSSQLCRTGSSFAKTLNQNNQNIIINLDIYSLCIYHWRTVFRSIFGAYLDTSNHDKDFQVRTTYPGEQPHRSLLPAAEQSEREREAVWVKTKVAWVQTAYSASQNVNRCVPFKVRKIIIVTVTTGHNSIHHGLVGGYSSQSVAQTCLVKTLATQM